jgi:hypothetical protein
LKNLSWLFSWSFGLDFGSGSCGLTSIHSARPGFVSAKAHAPEKRRHGFGFHHPALGFAPPLATFPFCRVACAPPGAVCAPDFLPVTEPLGFPSCGSPELLVVRRFGFVQSVQASASSFYCISLPSSNWVLRRFQSEFVDLPSALPSSPESAPPWVFSLSRVRVRALVLSHRRRRPGCSSGARVQLFRLRPQARRLTPAGFVPA